MYNPWNREHGSQEENLVQPVVRTTVGKKEITLVLSGAGLVWLAAVLFSFNPNDYSLFHYVWPLEPVRNWGGALGAHIAALSYVFFGPASWGLLLSGVFLFPTHRTSSRWLRWGRVLSFAMIVISAAALCSVAQYSLTTPFTGGLVGEWAVGLQVWIGRIGCVLLYGASLLFASLIFLHVSIKTSFTVVYRIVSFVSRIIGRIFLLVGRFFWGNVRALWGYKSYEELPEKSPFEYTDFSFKGGGGEGEKTEGDADNSGADASVPQEVFIVDEIAQAETAEVSDEQNVHDQNQFYKEEKEGEYGTTLFCNENVASIETLSGDTAATNDNVVEELEHEETMEDDDDDGDTESLSEDEKSKEEYVEPLPEYTPPKHFDLPKLTLFDDPPESTQNQEAFHERCQERATLLEEKLAHFEISGRIVGIHPGPVITVYEYEPEVGSKVSRILALEDDLALSLKALSIRIIAPVPGTSVVGFEIANEERSNVYFSSVMNEANLKDGTKALPLALGVDTRGAAVIYDLAKMPHLLVAGATGSGKSVGMNVMLTSLLSRLTPDQARFILIDPKRLEFIPYADIPHLLFPIVTSPYEVAPVLKWVVQEMELRYEVMAQAGVRSIAVYHKLGLKERFKLEHGYGLEVKGMPYIIIMVDELADLMMIAGKEIEVLVARISQMARAAGIHMIVATQRPSVDVVTGIIKVNFPSRVAFRVSTKIDSRTIIDGAGAEKLLGKGDMLFLSPASPALERLHGPFVTDDEICRLTEFLKAQREVEYLSLQQIIARHTEQAAEEEADPLYEEVCEYLQTVEEVSISLLQRRYRVGYNRSARLIEQLERDGHIAPAQGSKPRRVLRD